MSGDQALETLAKQAHDTWIAWVTPLLEYLPVSMQKLAEKEYHQLTEEEKQWRRDEAERLISSVTNICHEQIELERDKWAKRTKHIWDTREDYRKILDEVTDLNEHQIIEARVDGLSIALHILSGQ